MVLDFIKRFQNDGTITVFTSGCCYWFARILFDRFQAECEAVRIMYDPVANHFVTEIAGRLYDITGDVTLNYNTVDWNQYCDEIHKQRLIKQCINFIK